MPTKQGIGSGTAGYDNLDPTLKAIADEVVRRSNGAVWIGSGWRSNAEQTSLYNRWQNGTYDVPRVARPGTSQHEHGRAIDFGGDLRLAQQIGRELGLVFPMPDEPWHGQLGGSSRGSTDPDFGSLGIQYDLNYTGNGQAISPEEVLANRMNAIMSSIGGNEFTSGALSMVGPSTDVQGTLGAPGGMVPSHMTSTNDQFMQPQVSGNNLNNMQVSFAQGGSKAQLQSYARSLFGEFGFQESDYPALVELWNRESGWDPMAQNPTSSAFGIAQFLNGTWRGTGIQKTTNPQQQIMAGLMYIRSRYGTPQNALAFHNQHNWY